MRFNTKKIILIFLFVLYLSSITPVFGNLVKNQVYLQAQHQMDTTKCYQKIRNSYTDIDPIYITSNSSFTPQGFSGSGSSSDPYILENCRITNKTEPKLIWIENTNAYFIIRNNYIDGINKSATGPTGIYLYKVTNGVVEKNTFVNTWMGVWLGRDSNNNIITNNTFKNNTSGIRAKNSFNNTYTNNNIFNNTYYGIFFRGNSRDIISNNNIYENDNYGIDITDGISNLVMNNSVVNNGGGISIDDGEQNTIYNNSIIGNNMSGLIISNGLSGNFHLYASSNITSNTIMNNGAGLTIWSWGNFKSAGGPNNVSKNIIIQNNGDGIYIDSLDYTITENVIYSNDGIGIRLGNDARSVIVKGNDFIGNELLHTGFQKYDSQAYNQGYNNNFSKNYWDDWTCPDADADGIVDNSYPFCGYGCDASPLTTPHNDIPVDLHLLSRPRILYPKGEELGAFEGYKGKITVKWCSVTDFSGHSVFYTLYYSDGGGGSWEKVVTDLITLEYEWDTTKVENGGSFLKVVAECSEGGTSEYSSCDGFDIENPIYHGPHGWSFAMLTLTLCLLVFASRRKKSK